MNSKIDFVKGNTKKSLFMMVMPLFAAMLLSMAYNLVDSLWVGNLLGERGYIHCGGTIKTFREDCHGNA